MWLYYRVMRPNEADGMANRVDPDQTEQFDLSLLCLPRPACPKTEDYFGNCIKTSVACYVKRRFKRT